MPVLMDFRPTQVVPGKSSFYVTPVCPVCPFVLVFLSVLMTMMNMTSMTTKIIIAMTTMMTNFALSLSGNRDKK